MGPVQKFVVFFAHFRFFFPPSALSNLFLFVFLVAKKNSCSRASPPLYLPHLAISCCRFRKKIKIQFCLFVLFCLGFVFFFFFFGWVLFSWSIVAAGEEFCSRRSLLATHKLLLEAKQSASSSRGHELQTLFFFFSFFFFFWFFLFLLLFFRL